MCVPYIYRVPDPQPHRRGRNVGPGPPITVRKIRPPTVTLSAQFSPQIPYRPPASKRQGSNSSHCCPGAPHPTPETQFVEDFRHGEQAQEKDQQDTHETERRLEEGRAGLPQTTPPSPVPAPPSQEPVVPASLAKASPQPQSERAMPFPSVTRNIESDRDDTRSPYTYIHRSHRYRPSQRSRSSSVSSVSRRSFENLTRKVNAMLDRLIRLERWKEEQDRERKSKRVRWELDPGQGDRRRNSNERSRIRNRDVEIGRERRHELERWDWEGGGLGGF